MLLRSMRVIEKIFGSCSSQKKSNLALRQKQQKTFTKAHKALEIWSLKLTP